MSAGGERARLEELSELWRLVTATYDDNTDVQWVTGWSQKGRAQVIERWGDEEPVICVAPSEKSGFAENFPGEWIARAHNDFPWLLKLAEEGLAARQRAVAS